MDRSSDGLCSMEKQEGEIFTKVFKMEPILAIIGVGYVAKLLEKRRTAFDCIDSVC